MNKTIKKIALISGAFFPLAAFAQQGLKPTGCQLLQGATIGDVFGLATCIIAKYILPFFITLAIAVFIWGVIKFIREAENEEERKKGKEFMIYGIIALFVIVSVWGLVNVLIATFGFKNVLPQLPTVPGVQ